MYFWWSFSTLYVLFACQVRVTVRDSGLCCCVCLEDVPLVEFMYLVFTHMPGGVYVLVFTLTPGVYVPCIYSHARWSLCTVYIYIICRWWSSSTCIDTHVPQVEFMYRVYIYIYADGGAHVPCIYRHVPQVEFMYLVFTRMPGGVYVPCIYTHARWSLCTLYLHACQVRVAVGDSGLCSCACVTSFER